MLEICQHFFAGGKAVETRVRAGVRVHVGGLIHHVNLRQIVAQPGLKVVGIMRRCYLDRAGAELRVGQVVEDDADLALQQRQ